MQEIEEIKLILDVLLQFRQSSLFEGVEKEGNADREVENEKSGNENESKGAFGEANVEGTDNS